MKKVSTASFVIGVLLIVASIVLFILGILNINTAYAYSRSVNGFTYTRISYSISVNGLVNGFMMILFGGIAFLGGFLSFILAAVTRGPRFPKPECGPKPRKCFGDMRSATSSDDASSAASSNASSKDASSKDAANCANVASNDSKPCENCADKQDTSSNY